MTPVYRVFHDDTCENDLEKVFGVSEAPMRMGQLVQCLQANVSGVLSDPLSFDLELYEPTHKSVGYLIAERTLEPESDPWDFGYFHTVERSFLHGKSKRRVVPAPDFQSLTQLTHLASSPDYTRATLGHADLVVEPIAVALTATAVDYICELLRELWLTQTANESSMARTYSHAAFRQIVSLGEAALPFMFRHLADEPELWTVGLSMVTESDPVQSAKSPEEAILAWQEWRRVHRPS
jgi:hypothetical protein